ncbi:tyrosine-type recombinase/integrase [Yersinia ruckeri]|uniref:tyrosine-type recombinase/integrase n=1 Tax=Yersinia ruckeri TaxID=29486 RepID=UPI0020BE07D4|nr:tyrosine-type recombinase/integrase [Yersinia ruckeri]EKN4689596.1 tyrosine-type recombinase/integrase [Yersinia ruckeri]MCK8586382.1 tyrosine-type recombinase/integrase [Yersinia ruckeri]MCW6615624.1 tyrosine-type recombinase/integrase [Yersinia ruckeri]
MAGGLSLIGRDAVLIPDNPDLNDEVLRNLNAFVKDKEAFAENTWNQLIIAVRQWCRWCISKGRPYLPVDPDYMRDYLIELHESGLASSTISNRAAMLNMLHRQAGLIPAGESEKVKRALKKINRVSITKGETTGQAIPFRVADLNKIDDAWKQSDQLKDVRNLAFLFIAYNTLLRVSNIARLKVRDVVFNADGTVILNIGYTKTIVDGQGLAKALSPRASASLIRWLNVSGLIEHSDAYIFCKVHRVNKAVITTDKPMATPNLELIFSSAWKSVHGDKLGVENKGRYSTWTGHSARVGAAQDMTESGHSLAQIMHEGTWRKAETVLGYIRNIDAKNSVMIDLVEGK